jgi:pre-mRNA-processing factor 17
VFHGKELYDYQGRSYVDFPSHIKVRDDAPPAKNFAPKKLLHTWSGHSKGVSAIRFFPKSGHLLLSSSMDGTVKLWDVHNQRKCLRTFTGHDQAVKDISFSPDGRRFISCSYDRYVKCWDTETGQCISRHTSKKIPVCVKWFPEEGAHDHEFLCGQSNKLVVQWDLRENKIVQQYDEHLGPVNSITFIDNNRRFLSTSDDKKVLIWEYGIPVVVKHLAEPDMHSMPATTLHPNGKFWLGQSQDNQILCYGASGKFKLNTKKRFRGHLSAGYACQVDVSPDGKLVMSGDAEGRVFFWDWRSMRVFAKLKAHDKVTIGCAWHPLEQSRVATCSWDGTIKYWD